MPPVFKLDYVSHHMPTVEANGLHIYYEKFGTGPALTILGGLGDSTRNWGIVARELGKHFTVLVPDTRGSGQSEHTEPPYSIELFAKDTLAFWDALNVASSQVMGFSMGGMVALVIAAQDPKYVERLVLVSTSPGKKKYSPDHPGIKQIMENYSLTENHFSQTYEILFSEKFREKFDQKMFVKFKSGDPNPQDKKYFLAQYEAVKSFDGSNLLAKIPHPTLIIAGTSDGMISQKGTRYLGDHLRHSQLLLYPDCGHIPQMEEPQRFYRDVIEFLKPEGS